MEEVSDRSLGDLTDRLRAALGNPREGLPKDVFLLVSAITPLINVDLLIQNDDGETLLTWREDEFYGPGWHVPGGIVRFKEKFSTRIDEVARSELGTRVTAGTMPLLMNEVMTPHRRASIW